MVNGNLARQEHIELPENPLVKDDPLKWCSVSLKDIFARGKRLDASSFDVEAKQAYETIYHGKYQTVSLISEEGPVKDAFYGARLKRNYVDPNYPNAIGFLGSSEMLDIKPVPIKFMANTSRIKALKVFPNTILLSRSGTIGNLTFVGHTLSEYLVSEHAIRLICREYPGYAYAFLKSKEGQLLIQSNIFGAVIQEIEPAHLATIPIPNAPAILKQRINDLVVRSYALRDESNELIDEATRLLIEALKLPPLEELKTSTAPVETFSVKISRSDRRFDASYHVPIVNKIIEQLQSQAAEATTIGDPRISKEVILPGRFKRVYVEEGHGRVLIGGKQINELDPATKKYISVAKYSKKILESLEIHTNTTLITRSGTIGKVAIAPRHWEHWIPSDHIIRVVPASKKIAGYLYIFLASDYGHELITRYTYGSVVDEIDDNHVRNICVPFLKDAAVQANINELALAANQKRYEAYKLEQEALQIMNDDVIHAR